MNYINETTHEYPISEAMIRALNPNVSFPIPFVAPAPYAPVTAVAIPPYDPITQGYREVAPVKVGGVWTQRYTVYSLPPDQVAANEQAEKDNFISSAKVEAKNYIDTFAQTRDYVDADSCCGYYGSAVAQLAADSAYLRPERDNIVAISYGIFLQVQDETISVPTMEWFLEQLPVLEWPDSSTWAGTYGTPNL